MSKPPGEGWKAVGGFFRIFDIAFFLPGAVVVLASLLVRNDWWVKLRTSFTTVFGTSTQGDTVAAWTSFVALSVSFAAIVFVAGLFCHAVARVVRAMLILHLPKGLKTYWKVVNWLFELGGQKRQGGAFNREESQLSLYLWNLASLSWNLAAALLLVTVLCIQQVAWSFLVLLLAGAALLAMLGSEFRHYADIQG